MAVSACSYDCVAMLPYELGGPICAIVLALITQRWRFVPLAAVMAWLIGEVAIPAAIFGSGNIDAWLLITTSHLRWGASRYLYLLTVVAFVFGLKHAIVSAAAGQTHVLWRYASGAATAAAGALGFAALYAFAPAYLPEAFRPRVAEHEIDLSSVCKAGSAVPVAGLPPFKGSVQRAGGARAVGPLSAMQMSLPAVHTTQMRFEHQFGFPEHIRVSNPKRYGPDAKVAVTLAINERGDVVAATPFGGPRDLFGRAVAIVSGWKFAPFVRDGRPVPVRVLRVGVAIAGPENWRPLPLQYPDYADLDAVRIRFSNHNYEQRLTLEIRGDGTVAYQSSGKLIAVHGTHCAQIDRGTVAALLEQFRRANFFALESHYRDSREGNLSISIGAFAHEVRILGAGENQAPEVYWRLVQSLLDAVHAERWTRGNQFTGATLAAERWDFNRATDENKYMLANVAKSGNAKAVSDLLALGAPLSLSGEPDQIEFAANATISNPDRLGTALEEAANAGAFDVVTALLATSARWPRDSVSGAYVSAIEHGNVAIAGTLLQRGADPRRRGKRKRSALMAAATAGLPDLVERELRRGADVRAEDDEGFTALHWAAGVDYLKNVDSVRADRARVIKMLLAGGAKADERAKYYQWTPLLANWMGLPEVTSILIANGADVNARDEEGNTPLMLHRSVESVRLLLAAGANPYLRNNMGQNALDVARADAFWTEIAQELERWMAAHPETK